MNIKYIIAGLGNTGKEYEKTRHNVGFKAIDECLESSNIQSLQENKKTNCLEGRTKINKKNILFLKPLSFMNKSGESLFKTIKYYDLQEKNPNLIVFHDDSDQFEGNLKISLNGGSAGHKGIESIYKYFKKNQVIRIKIGIRPINNNKKSETFVLKNYSKRSLTNNTIKKSPEILNCLTEKSLEHCQSLFN